jgi:dTDP-glucose 4,6-dehydratase
MDQLKKDLKLKNASQAYLKKLKKLLKMYQDGKMSLNELSVVTELDKDKLLDYFHKSGKAKKKILICGGAGFIGSNFIHHLLRKYPGYEIINYDKLTYAGNLDNLKDIENNPHYKFIKGDIADAKKVEETFKKEKPDMIVNFSAESISGDTYLPIYRGGKIMIETFEELFKRIAKYSQNKVKKSKNGVEVIDIKEGKAYKALSNYGGIGYWQPIRQISRHYFEGNLICLNQKWGEIVATNNHSIYDIQGKLTTPQKNPTLLSLRNINYICKKNFYQNFKGKKLESLLRIMAAYITEGNATFNKANGGHIVSIANQDKQWIDLLIKDFKKLGYKPGCLKRKEGWYQLTIVNKYFYNFLRETCGVYSKHKFIPPFVFQLKPALQRLFLENLIQGDGETIRNKNYNSYRYTTNSKKLATGLSLLLTLLKENLRVHKDERFNAYTLSFGNDYKISSLNKKKKTIPYKGYVYDIEVADTHNFVCGVGNIVAHNTHVDRSIHDGAREFLEANVLGVHTLLEAVRHHKTEKYIQISTDETYGTVALDDNRKFTEDTPFAPNVPYAAAKAGGDLMCRAYNKTHNVPVIVTHCSNNYGPYQYPEKLIPFILFKALHKEKLPIYGDGKNVRDWIYVLDHCQAIDDILHKGKPGEVYNIGADQERDNLTVARAILKILGRSDNLITFVDDRPGHDRRYSIDATKIKKELNWEPTKIFEKTLPNVVDWYLNNQWWIRNIQKRGGAFNIHIKK